MYRELGVRLPRLDLARMSQYHSSLVTYNETSGKLLRIDDRPETCKFLAEPSLDPEESAKVCLSTSLQQQGIPEGTLVKGEVGAVTFLPGERAVCPVEWIGGVNKKIEYVSTHPAAPEGIVVLPGPSASSAASIMNVIVINEGSLPATLTEKDMLAVAAEEWSLPSLEYCRSVVTGRVDFIRSIDWKGGTKDKVKELPPDKEGRKYVLILSLIHI